MFTYDSHLKMHIFFEQEPTCLYSKSAPLPLLPYSVWLYVYDNPKQILNYWPALDHTLRVYMHVYCYTYNLGSVR